MSVLNISNLNHSFGGLKAIHNFNLSIEESELIGVIGPNGAGKSTLFNIINGFIKPDSGSIEFLGNSITGMKPYQINRLGIGRTFQTIKICADMSVIDNVKVAAIPRVEYNFFHSLMHSRYFWQEEERLDDYCYCLLQVFGLHKKAEDRAGSLPYGMQKRLEIARALATQPKLLLLDEPACGMNPSETKELIQSIHWMRDEFEITVLIIEHNMRLVMDISQRIYVMNFGELIATGTPKEVQNNQGVIDAYLGKGVHNVA